MYFSFFDHLLAKAVQVITLNSMFVLIFYLPFSQFFESMICKQHFSELPGEHSPKVWNYIKLLKENDMKEYFAKDFFNEVMF